MGMFDTVTVEGALPDGRRGAHLQTKSLECAGTSYTLAADGRLWRHDGFAEVVPDEERPAFGTPQWDKPFYRLFGSLRFVETGRSPDLFSGILEMHDGSGEYRATLIAGRLFGEIRRAGEAPEPPEAAATAARYNPWPAQEALNRWISEHNPEPGLNYAKGWWDVAAFYQKLAERLQVELAAVAGEYRIATPPPCEELLLPLVRLERKNTIVHLKTEFAACGDAWRLSIERPQGPPGADPLALLGLFDPAATGLTPFLSALPPELELGPYGDNPLRFTCSVYDEWAVFALLQALWHPPRPEF